MQLASKGFLLNACRLHSNGPWPAQAAALLGCTVDADACGQGHVSCGTQQCQSSHPRPSQNRLTWKFKNFMFLAAAQASAPRLVSIFSHSWGSSNLAIPQSAAAVVVWRDRGMADFIIVCSST